MEHSINPSTPANPPSNDPHARVSALKGCSQNGMSTTSNKETMRAFLAGETDLVYMTPEFAAGPFCIALAQVPFNKQPHVSLLVLDECHLIEEWARDGIVSLVRMRWDFVDVHVDLDRPEIYISQLGVSNLKLDGWLEPLSFVTAAFVASLIQRRAVWLFFRPSFSTRPTSHCSRQSSPGSLALSKPSPDMEEELLDPTSTHPRCLQAHKNKAKKTNAPGMDVIELGADTAIDGVGNLLDAKDAPLSIDLVLHQFAIVAVSRGITGTSTSFSFKEVLKSIVQPLNDNDFAAAMSNAVGVTALCGDSDKLSQLAQAINAVYFVVRGFAMLQQQEQDATIL
ncbi:hypothetical protein BCR44DRAFT_38306 [Catenaria anguillulae PL171]|uniref:Uncharacterized protein n=1 Tax=Catenaria anguillulae PL171 TaxID=765915 RepID=A0A1Y2I1M5_9FUNG|nr:hypothetical protein BCR44DRAFT_38306 [Catenaria anguillulae PL171]